MKMGEERKKKGFLRIIWFILGIVILGISFIFLFASVWYLINYPSPLFQEWGISKTWASIILGLSFGGFILGAAIIGACQIPLIKFSKPELAPDEEIAFSLMSKRHQSRLMGWVGGMLYKTNKRVVFLPNTLDMKFGGKKLELGNAEIRQIKQEKGKLYGKVKIITKDGREETFRVRAKDLEKLPDQA
jgi:hypothetical protein